MLVLILVGLATAIALGHVEEQTSYGLKQLLDTITRLTEIFGIFKFGKPKERT